MPSFERFLVSSGSKASWSHPKPKKSNSMVSPRSVDPPGHPGGVLIVEWKKIELLLPQCATLEPRSKLTVKNDTNGKFIHIIRSLKKYYWVVPNLLN